MQQQDIENIYTIEDSQPGEDGQRNDTMTINMGPQHPSTHGVLRLILTIEGETVVKSVPDIGFLHTGIEKTAEAKSYHQALVLTDRMDYLAPLCNNLVTRWPSKSCSVLKTRSTTKSSTRAFCSRNCSASPAIWSGWARMLLISAL